MFVFFLKRKRDMLSIGNLPVRDVLAGPGLGVEQPGNRCRCPGTRFREKDMKSYPILVWSMD